MSEGFKTRICFQQETTLLGDLEGDIFALSGRVQFFADRVLAGEHTRVDAFRRLRTNEAVQVSYRVGFECELSLGEMVSFFLNLLFSSDFVTDTTFKTLRGFEPVPTLTFFAAFDNGQKWRFGGAAVASLEFEINARRIVRMRGSFVALVGEEIDELPDATVTEISGPVEASRARLYGSNASDWDIPSNAMGSTDAVSLRLVRDIEAAQFGDDGRPSRHSYISNWRALGEFTAIPSGALMGAFMLGIQVEGKLAVVLGDWQFIFPGTRYELKTQPFLDPRLVKCQVEWSAFGNPVWSLPVGPGDTGPTCPAFPANYVVLVTFVGVHRSGHPDQTIDGTHRCVFGKGLDVSQTGWGKQFDNTTYGDARTFVRAECFASGEPGWYATAYDELTGPMDGLAGIVLDQTYEFGGLFGWTVGTIILHVTHA